MENVCVIISADVCCTLWSRDIRHFEPRGRWRKTFLILKNKLFGTELGHVQLLAHEYDEWEEPIYCIRDPHATQEPRVFFYPWSVWSVAKKALSHVMMKIFLVSAPYFVQTVVSLESWVVTLISTVTLQCSTLIVGLLVSALEFFPLTPKPD